MINDFENNQQDFWKKIGRMGIANKKTYQWRLFVSSDVSTVLNKWKTSYENLHSKNMQHNLREYVVDSFDDQNVCNVFVEEPLLYVAILFF